MVLFLDLFAQFNRKLLINSHHDDDEIVMFGYQVVQTPHLQKIHQ